MKRFFEIIGFISLVCFSFFYTEKIATVIKNNDDVLKQIENVKIQSKTNPIDAKIEGNTIIPGMSGKIIDVFKYVISIDKRSTETLQVVCGVGGYY